MSANIDKIKDRIRKLFNLASNDAAADGEINNALKAARELMLAHQLSEDDVEAEPDDLRSPAEIAADTEYGTAKTWGNSRRAPNWQGSLGQAVAEFIGTVKMYHDNPEIHRKPSGIVANDGEPVTGWVFYGPHDDAVLASELHQELLLTCATTAKLRFGGKLMTGPGRDYCDGFARGLLDKVYAARRDVSQDATPKLAGVQCTALSVVRAGDIALAKVKRAGDWLKKEKGIHLRQTSGYGREVGDYGAYQQGKTDGGSQSLTKDRTARIGCNA